MDMNPPEGSRITISNEGAEPTIVIPPAGGAGRYFTGLFLLFWLGMWTIGFKNAASQVWAGTANAFIVLWLAAWTVGGVFAAATLYRIFRPAVPEKLALRGNSLVYDSGVQPPNFNSWRGQKQGRNPAATWKTLFSKRIRVELDRRQLQSLRLRETDTGNRLTIDLDAERTEIAAGAGEVEREWLARYLARRYSLAQVFGEKGAAAATTFDR